MRLSILWSTLLVQSMIWNSLKKSVYKKVEKIFEFSFPYFSSYFFYPTSSVRVGKHYKQAYRDFPLFLMLKRLAIFRLSNPRGVYWEKWLYTIYLLHKHVYYNNKKIGLHSLTFNNLDTKLKLSVQSRQKKHERPAISPSESSLVRANYNYYTHQLPN